MTSWLFRHMDCLKVAGTPLACTKLRRNGWGCTKGAGTNGLVRHLGCSKAAGTPLACTIQRTTLDCPKVGGTPLACTKLQRTECAPRMKSQHQRNKEHNKSRLRDCKCSSAGVPRPVLLDRGSSADAPRPMLLGWCFSASAPLPVLLGRCSSANTSDCMKVSDTPRHSSRPQGTNFDCTKVRGTKLGCTQVSSETLLVADGCPPAPARRLCRAGSRAAEAAGNHCTVLRCPKHQRSNSDCIAPDQDPRPGPPPPWAATPP